MIVWLTGVWIALWEEPTLANVIAGIAVAFIVSAVVPPRLRIGPPLGFRPFRAMGLAVYFLGQLTEASVRLAWEVLTPTSHINAAIVSVELTTSSPAIATLVANLVSLTPGTLTLEIDEQTLTLFIHVLHLESIEEQRQSVLSFERLALAAFPEQVARPGSTPQETAR